MSSSSSSIPTKYIFVSSTNEIKVRSALDAFQQRFPHIHWIAQGVSEAASEVSNQPFNEETYQGCENRAKNVLQYLQQQERSIATKWDVIVSIENGVFEINKTSEGEVPQPVQRLWWNENRQHENESGGEETLQTSMSSYYDTCVIKVILNHSKDSDLLLLTDEMPTITTQGGMKELIKESSERVYIDYKYVKESLASNKTETCGSLIERDLAIPAGTWHERFHPGRTRFEIMRDCIISML